MVWLFALLTFVVQDTSRSWDGFLGGDGRSVQQELPTEWSPEKNRAWNVEIPGHGQSSPVVASNRVFVTSTEGPNKDKYHVLCFEVGSGKEVWRKSIDNSVPFKNSLYVSRSAPTPVVDANQVTVFFESGDLVAYSLDGDLLWHKNLSGELGPFQAEFGLGASPCQNDSHVFVLLEHEGPSYLIGVNKKSGEIDWKASREPRSSWTSPAMISIEGQPQIVVSSKGSLDGYDPTDGKLLWTFSEIDGNTGATPIDLGDGKFLTGASGGRGGEPSPDTKKSNALMQVSKDGDQWKVERLWSAENASVSWASPIAYEGYAYWVNRVGVVQCFDMNSGESIYEERISDSCWATPLPVGKNIYFFGKGGEVTVVKAGQVFEKVSENKTFNADEIGADKDLPVETDENRARGASQFGAPTLYGYAVAGKSLLIRTGNRMFCIREQ